MLKEIATWLKAYELTPEQTVLATLLSSLASEYDAKPTVQLGAEIRKTRAELAKLLAGGEPEIDPLEQILRRNAPTTS